MFGRHPPPISKDYTWMRHRRSAPMLRGPMAVHVFFLGVPPVVFMSLCCSLLLCYVCFIASFYVAVLFVCLCFFLVFTSFLLITQGFQQCHSMNGLMRFNAKGRPSNTEPLTLWSSIPKSVFVCVKLCFISGPVFCC